MTPDISTFKLPSPSPEGIQIIEMLSEISIDLSILSDVISRDPMLAATVMKYANSPLYRRVIEIKSVHKAVNMLGLKNVATTILIATMRSFNTPSTKASESIWEHCIGVSAMAKLIARKVARSLQERAEFLATIHDIGAMVLATNHPDYDKVYQTTLDNKINLDDAEKEAFGYSHDDISAASLAKLKLPDEMTSLINYFHQRPAVTQINNDDDKLLAILSLAHQMEHQIHGDTRVN
ncbi:MAG: HDOD domain-containing protein [Gammaproteobacteria bacterium]|nr:HDOD domain-containing protein [Gammaproteobacteria bacterium]